MEHSTVLAFSNVPGFFDLHGGKNSVEQITFSRCNFPWKAMALHLIYYFSVKELNIPILTPNIPKYGWASHPEQAKHDATYFKKNK